MKKTKSRAKRKIPGALQEHYLIRLVVQPLARRIKQRRCECMEQSKIIFKKFQDINESIEMLARQLVRKFSFQPIMTYRQ